MDPILEILKLAFVGLVSSLFSLYLANRGHRDRKWWEMRVSAYQNAIESLADIVYYYDTHFDAENESRELSKELEAKLKANWEQAYPKIRRYADSGAFLFSAEANAALREFFVKEHADTYFDSINIGLGRASVCLHRLVECSKVDLRLNSKCFSILR